MHVKIAEKTSSFLYLIFIFFLDYICRIHGNGYKFAARLDNCGAVFYTCDANNYVIPDSCPIGMYFHHTEKRCFPGPFESYCSIPIGNSCFFLSTNYTSNF